MQAFYDQLKQDAQRGSWLVRVARASLHKIAALQASADEWVEWEGRSA